MPESMRRRAEELEQQPPLEKARAFLGTHVNDMISLDEVRASVRLNAASRIRWLRLDLHALDTLISEPQPPGLLAELVAWDANWVLDDPSDEGAKAFLRQIADILREVLAEAERARGGGS